MESTKRLRVLALRGDATEDEELFHRLQDEVLLTSAWTLDELELLLKGGTYDLFICTRPLGGRDCRAAVRLVRENAPMLPGVSYCIEEGRPNKLRIVQAGAAGMVPQEFIESPVLSMLERLAIHGVLESKQPRGRRRRGS